MCLSWCVEAGGTEGEMHCGLSLSVEEKAGGPGKPQGETNTLQDKIMYHRGTPVNPMFNFSKTESTSSFRPCRLITLCCIVLGQD